MFDGRDLDGAERMVDDWQVGFEQRASQARVLSGRLAELSGSAHSDDGLVKVTVGPSGSVTDLRLDEGIRRRPAIETARAILATLHAAQAALTRQAATAVAETLGAESETGRAVLAAFVAREPAGAKPHE